MEIPDDAAEARAHGWRTLAALHALIEDELERALQREHGLSVSEYSVLDVLSRQDGFCLRMNQLARAVVLSRSAITRLVSRMEGRGLLRRCLSPDDRRGIYTEVTAEGLDALGRARPTHDASLTRALGQARGLPELAPLADVVDVLPD
ncbi:MarR family winged helix-turn-helix transcriptional regulator [Actinomadura roseirufa]|uniref:MarR family winged helix-turn-helix transcriptional regulator n=1 Tax=Actinomadura roseirufa TaxID=2094049 RepID=UPI0010419D51|nr:MarR family transcriptional regulator [Actinomadura roseirufa]